MVSTGRHHRLSLASLRWPTLLAAALLVSLALSQLGRSTPDGLSEQLAPMAACSLSGAINGFGDVIFDSVAKRLSATSPRAVFLSPYSVAQALAMLLPGMAPGSASQRQLASAVFGGAGAEAVPAQMQQLRRSLEQAGQNADDVTLAEADSAWLSTRYALQPAYASELQATFDAEAAPLTGAQPVNAWVAAATRGKISEVIDESIAARSALVLVNALYFKGLWEHAFDKGFTARMDFALGSGQRVGCAMMYRAFKGREAVARFQAGGVPCVAVRLPYRGGDYSAVLAMPEGELGEAAGPLQLAEGGAYAPGLEACRSHVARALAAGAAADGACGGGGAALEWAAPHGPVKLWLPRFEAETSAELEPHLRAAGVSAPFVPGDLTRIAAFPDGSPVADLAVSNVIHKVFVKVDELGTEAAAVTAIAMMRGAFVPVEETLLRFDRPFAFFVAHGPSGLALFGGEVLRPDDWQEA